MLLYNSRLRLITGKIKGPFKVIHVFDNGAIEVEDEDGSKLKVNGKRLKLYFEERSNVAMIEVVYLEDD